MARDFLWQWRRGTAAAWTLANPTLAQGEPAYETDTGKIKVGDGTSAWTSLAYASVPTSNATFTGEIIATDFDATGLTGATDLSRYVGATTTGHPTTGTFRSGDFIVTHDAQFWVCTTSGSPGTWTLATGGGGGSGDMVAAHNLSDLTDASVARTNLGLGSAATHPTTDFDAAGSAAAAQAASQPLDSDLTAIAALSTTSYGRSLLALADAAAGRTSLGLGTASTSASTDFQPVDSDLTAIAALTTTSFGRSFLALADAAAGRTLLGLGTAATSATSAFDAAGAAAAAQAASQPLDSDLTTIAGLTATTDSFLQSKSSAWAARTVAQVKTDLGLTGTNSGDQTITLTGDVTGTGTGSFAATLKNTGPGATGPIGDGTHVSTVTIDAQGRVTGLTSTAITSSGADKLGLTPTAVKTANYTAVAGDFVPVDLATTGSWTLTLPTAPADGTVVAAKIVAISGTRTLSLALGGSDVFNIAGGATTGSLSVLNQAAVFQYKSSSAIWYTVTTDLPLSQLDLRYLGITTAIPESQVTGLSTDLASLLTAIAGKAASASPALTGTPTFAGSTSGTTGLQASATASGTLTLPAATDTLVGKATTDTLTNKTLTSPTMTTPTLGVATATTVNKVTITAPASAATLTIPDGVTLTGPAASGTAMTLGNGETVTGQKTFTSGTTFFGSTTGALLRGYRDAGAAVASLDALTTISASGATDTSSTLYQGASIVAQATQAWTGVNGGSKLTFKTTANGTHTLADALTIDQDKSATFVGTLTGGTYNKVTITAPASGATLTIPDGVALTGPATSGTAATLGNAETFTGAKTFGAAGAVGKLIIAGTTSGSTILDATAVAGSGTVTLPTTGTLATLAGSETFTNKTLTSPTMTTPTLGVASATTINKVTITAPASAATLTIPDGVTLTGPAASGTAMTLGNTETVSGTKTFTAGNILSGSALGGNLTIYRDNAAAVTSGQTIGALLFRGATDGSATRYDGASVAGVPTETFSGTAGGSKLTFNTTANTTHTLAVALTLDQDKSALFTNSIKSSSASAGVGYATGAGGNINQASSRTTGVTLDKICGSITMLASTSISATSNQVFTFTNAVLAVGDVVACSVTGGTAGAYQAWATNIAGGSCTITLRNTSAGALVESPVINFVIVKAVTS